MLPGCINFIGASASNNGLTGKISNNTHLHPAGTITVTYNGSVGECFYQTERFWASDDVNVLYPKFEMNEQIALFFLAPLSKKGKGYGYAFKWTKEKMENDSIELPIKSNGEIDFDFIESRIRELEESRIRELEAYLLAAGFEDCTLTQSERNALRCIATGQKEMRKFRIVDEFTVANSHNILKSDVVFGSGSTPYVTASEGNNSIVSYISYKHDMIEKGNSIMIGGKTLVITYQPDDFFSNDSHNLVLTINHELGRTESAHLFMVAALYKSLSPKYSWGDSISKAKIQNDEVFLPVKADGTIDFAFMNTYISAIKKQCIAALKQEISREHQAYEQAIGSPSLLEQPKTFPLYPTYHDGCVPLYSLRVACGEHEDGVLPEGEGWIDASGLGFTPDPQRHFAVYAKGNSMYPKIKDGDICVFEWYHMVGGSREGKIVLNQIREHDPSFEGPYTIKEYHSVKKQQEDGIWEHKKISLIPLNKDYKVISLNEETEYRTIGILKCVLPME